MRARCVAVSAGSVSAHLRGEAALLEREDHQLDALRLEEERLVRGRVQRAAEAVIHVLDQLSLLKGLPREDAGRRGEETAAIAFAFLAGTQC